MAITKKNSKWVNPKWPLYVCKICGNEYYTKFQDTNKCMECNKGLHEEIQHKLSGRKQDINPEKFKEKYLDKRTKKEPEKIVKPAPSNRKGIKRV